MTTWFFMKLSLKISVTAKMSAHVKEARSRYFADQRERSLKVRTERDSKLRSVHQNIEDINKEITYQ